MYSASERGEGGRRRDAEKRPCGAGVAGMMTSPGKLAVEGIKAATKNPSHL